MHIYVNLWYVPRKEIYSETCFKLSDLSSAWVANINIIAPAGMINQTSVKITEKHPI